MTAKNIKTVTKNQCKKTNMFRTIFLRYSNHSKNEIKRFVNTTAFLHNKNKTDDKKNLVVQCSFEQVTNKTKNTYIELIEIFINRDVHRRGHVEFIHAALKNMIHFNVHKDLEVYKALINVLPKGKFIPTNMLQSEFMHYPKQQQCIIELLEQMEDNGVLPDEETEDILLNIFGKRGYPLRKYWRIMYWMPKFKNLSPWPLPQTIPNDTFELAKIAITRISVDIQTKITEYWSADIPNSIDDTWIISSQSPIQKKLLAKNDKNQPVYIEGGFRIWIKDKPVNYFLLKATAEDLEETEEDNTDDVSNIKVSPFYIKPQSKIATLDIIHKQNDGIILAICATGTSSKDSLLSWIRHLQNDGNPTLEYIPIVFTLKSNPNELTETN